MGTTPFIIASYAVTAAVIGGMIAATWLRDRRVRRQLKASDRP